MLSAELADENYNQSRAAQLPNLSGNAGHNYNFGRTLDFTTYEYVSETNQTNSFGLNSGMTLFNGMQIRNGIKQSAIDLEASRLDVDATKNDIALSIASQYLLILFNEEQLVNAEKQVALTQQQVDRTARLVEAGSVARSAKLELEAQLASEELAIVNARNQLNISKLGLA